MGKVAVVTGVTGQDGALLSRFLLDRGYKVIGVTRRTSSKTDWRLQDLKLYDNPAFYVASGDLTDAPSINEIVKQHQPDEFYNLGAMSFVKESWNTKAATMQINAVGPVNCLEAIRHFAPECRFYQASTSEMFGGKLRTETLSEASDFYPRSPYGYAKLAAHWAVVNQRESYDQFACAGILFNHESEYRGLEFVTRKITDGVARIYLGLQDTIELGNLDAKRDWGYAGDFVRGMYYMLQQDTPDDYVLATGEAYSIEDFVIAAFEAAGFDDEVWRQHVKQNPEFMRPADVGHLLGDPTKAVEKLGWEREVDFTSLVQIMVEKDIDRVRTESLRTP